MTVKKPTKYVVFGFGIVIISLATFLLTPIMVAAHGGKTHAGTRFSHLQALQKATQMYARLVTSGKLNEDWELALKQIDISSRSGQTGKETVVSLTRSEGEPTTVFFFFKIDGEYAGSNFDGK